MKMFKQSCTKILAVFILIFSQAYFMQKCLPKYATTKYHRNNNITGIKWSVLHGQLWIEYVYLSEMGYSDVEPKLFNPTNFIADQVVSVAKSAFFNGLVLVI